MLTSANFVVHSFTKFWRCELSGLIAELSLPFLVIRYSSIKYCESHLGFIYFFIIVVSVWNRGDGMEDRYSILIRFRSQDSADNFYKHLNERRYSSLEVGQQCWFLICLFILKGLFRDHGLLVNIIFHFH